MTIQTVGLLSPGDMGHVVGQVLLQHGMRVVTCLQGRSERTCMLSRQAGIAEVPTYEQLVREARDAGIGVTLDAEEAERLELSLLLVDKLLESDVTSGYAGFGLAVHHHHPDGLWLPDDQWR